MADIAIDDQNPFGIIPQYVFTDILYNLGLNGENEKIHEATNTFLGHGVPNNEIDGQYFICSARPRQNIENNTFLNNTDGKLYSLMDGEGGPGGDGPAERFSGTGYFVQDNFPVYGAVPESGQINIPYARSSQLGLQQGNPVINATKRASTAFGL